MNKVKKVLMTMFGLLMFPLLFACSNTQYQGVEAIKAKGKLVVALNPEFAPFEYQKLVDGKNQIVGSDVELAKAIVEAFLTTGFEGGRHKRRIDKIPC